MPEKTDLRAIVARIAKLVRGLPERVLSVEKGHAQLAVEVSEIKEQLSKLERLDNPGTDSSTNPDGFKRLSRDDVIKVNEVQRIFLDHPTFQAEAWLKALNLVLCEAKGNSFELEEWISGVIECQVLAASGKGWQSGKLRLNMEFCPDQEPEEEPTD